MSGPARFGEVDRTTVHIDCWMTIHSGSTHNYPRRPSVKLTAGEPALDRGERAINVKMNLPLALFEAPSIVAHIDVAEPSAPITIDASAVAEALKSAIGMDIDLKVIAPNQGTEA